MMAGLMELSEEIEKGMLSADLLVAGWVAARADKMVGWLVLELAAWKVSWWVAQKAASLVVLMVD